MTVFFSALGRFFVRLGPLLCCVAVCGWCGGAFAAAEAPKAASGLVIEGCGAMVPENGGDGRPAYRLTRPGEVLAPGDLGFGCRFGIPKQPKGGAVPVEIRVSRPTSAGGQALDRWFVTARDGAPTLAVYPFETPVDAVAGPWVMEWYRDGRLMGSRSFAMAAPPAGDGQPSVTPAPAQPVPTSAPEAVIEVPPPAPVAPQPAKPAAGRQKRAEKTREASRPEPPVAPAPRTAAPEAASGAGYYAWQIGIFEDAANAEGQAARARSRGMPVCVSTEQGPKGRRYRVLAGRYGDRRVALGRRQEVAAGSGGAVLYKVEPAAVGRLRCH